MKRFISAGLVAVNALLVSWLVMPMEVAAENVCSLPAPGHASDVRGYTWTGMLSDIVAGPLDGGGQPTFVMVFAVDHVYADANEPSFPKGLTLAVGEDFRMHMDTCGLAPGFKKRLEYLVSTSQITQFGVGTEQLVAWEVTGEHVVLADIYDGQLTHGPFIEPMSLDEALALVAPGAMPPTDPNEAVSPTSGPVDIAIPLVAFGAGWVVMRRRLRPTR